MLALEQQSHTPAPQVSAPMVLSSREIDVLRLIVSGYTIKEIAGLLDLSVKTVERRKMSSMRRLNLHTRSDIVHYALRHDWHEGTATA
jgi:DNA-binding NarL/FixJ family response regulator